jgi:polyisoprenyl-teichoic acid--peptidoglycan teichoic acid transferase
MEGGLEMKSTVKAIFILLGIISLFSSSSLAEVVDHHNYLIDPQPIVKYTAPAQNIKNILLLGIDKSDRAAAKGFDYHTDAIMILAVNLDEKRVDLVSLPRDTLTYVPGIKGIYKLNAAINCGGGKTEEGFAKACEAVSWMLGGIKIDYYCAIDMKAMVAIGDAISGVEFNLDMNYTGAYGKYHKGMQHLNGKGIVDYLRARRNATVNANDIGRTGRQRELIFAIFEKTRGNPALLSNVLSTVQKMDDAIFTNMSAADVMSYLPLALELDVSKVGSYVITGKYRTALQGWNFTFTDQETRKEVIQKVYGIEVPELKYVSYEYSKWLVNDGLEVVRYLSVAKLLREEVSKYDEAAMNAAQKEALAAFDLAYTQTQDAFDTAADSMSKADTELMADAINELRKHGDALYKLFDGIAKLAWTTGKYWYADRMINEIDVNFR